MLVVLPFPWGPGQAALHSDSQGWPGGRDGVQQKTDTANYSMLMLTLIVLLIGGIAAQTGSKAFVQCILEWAVDTDF